MYAERRRQVLDKISEGAAIFCATSEAIRNHDVHHDFRQDSDLYYLTGFEEPSTVLLLLATADKNPHSVLFLRERDIEREIWDGVRLGLDAALETLEVDEVYPIESLSEKLPTLLVGAKKVYYDLARHDREENDQSVLNAVIAAKRNRRRDSIVPVGIEDASPFIHELRLFKSKAEIDTMRRAAQLTAIGHRRAMEVTAAGVREYQLEAAMEYEWRVRGSARNDYPSIVGSGPNSCVLHYRAGHRAMNDGELVLVDAGCEKDYYASDVTRTWPVSGSFTKEQRQIYSLVLKAQKACIDTCRVGETVNSIHNVAVKVLVEGLIELGLLTGDVESLISDEAYKRFYMHQTSHWIGMDVHDVGKYTTADGAPRPFEEGMVLTVEPGIYISPSDTEVPASYRGIGIRIEDDILVTNDEPDNLSIDVPKELDEIEKIVGSRRLEL